MRPRPRLVVAALCATAFIAGCSTPAEPDSPPAQLAATTTQALTPTPTSPATPSAAPDTRPPASAGRLVDLRTIGGEISPKSVTATGTGLVFAQNMMYRHTVTVYDRDFDLVATISDEVTPSQFGVELDGSYGGAPVEAAATPDGRYVYVSNYSMYGPGFREGTDICTPRDDYPDSFVYRIDTTSLEIDQVIEVGAVPKYLAVTPDGATLLVTNWCSFDLSVVDVTTAAEVRRIPIGRYPRGIAIHPDSGTAWIAVMGDTRLVQLDLRSYGTKDLEGVGGGPRHLQISPDGAFLYVTLNRDGVVAKVDTATGETVAVARTGQAPRSAVLSTDGTALYVVNYESDTVAKVATADMSLLQTVGVGHHPIGITWDDDTRQLWVACYSGTIAVFQDGSA
ncbi:MAG: family beta-propeller repeat protein [Blastococcus sp.]|jgi:YVTN family beta-propeller protein|nr:family beta-propeller repeat protein [Blastococcus sp.]